jgi:hypothetical protein
MKLDDVRIGVRPGSGIVARLPGAVLVVPFDEAVEQSAVDRLLEECRKGPVAGRLDQVRAAAHPGVPSFALIGEVDDGLAVFVSGDVTAAIAGAEPVLRLSGTDLQGWGVRVPEGFATLDVGRVDPAPVDARLDLQAGVVPGTGVVLSTVRAAAPVAPAPAKPTRRKRAEPVAEASVAPPGVTEVWGIRCKKGHFNDPEARYCGICGIHMVQDSAARVKGPRPVLGFLVLDDGTSYKLDTDYVIGSDPTGHEAVVAGRARPLVVKADGDVVSPVHARIDLRDWDVFVSDCGSVYGTYVWSPGGTDWLRLQPEQQVRLGAGSQVMVAQRGFMFQPANKR